jgi:hypothetical protein
MITNDKEITVLMKELLFHVKSDDEIKEIVQNYIYAGKIDDLLDIIKDDFKNVEANSKRLDCVVKELARPNFLHLFNKDLMDMILMQNGNFIALSLHVLRMLERANSHTELSRLGLTSEKLEKYIYLTLLHIQQPEAQVPNDHDKRFIVAIKSAIRIWGATLGPTSLLDKIARPESVFSNQMTEKDDTQEVSSRINLLFGQKGAVVKLWNDYLAETLNKESLGQRDCEVIIKAYLNKAKTWTESREKAIEFFHDLNGRFSWLNDYLMKLLEDHKDTNLDTLIIGILVRRGYEEEIYDWINAHEFGDSTVQRLMNEIQSFRKETKDSLEQINEKLDSVMPMLQVLNNISSKLSLISDTEFSEIKQTLLTLQSEMIEAEIKAKTSTDKKDEMTWTKYIGAEEINIGGVKIKWYDFLKDLDKKLTAKGLNPTFTKEDLEHVLITLKTPITVETFKKLMTSPMAEGQIAF